MFKVNNKDTRTTPFIVNFEYISQLCSSVSIVNFEQVNADWAFFNEHVPMYYQLKTQLQVTKTTCVSNKIRP